MEFAKMRTTSSSSQVSTRQDARLGFGSMAETVLERHPPQRPRSSFLPANNDRFSLVLAPQDDILGKAAVVIRHCLRTAPEDEAQVFCLASSGVPLEEIAGRGGTSVEAVARHLQKFLATLQAPLKRIGILLDPETHSLSAMPHADFSSDEALDGKDLLLGSLTASEAERIREAMAELQSEHCKGRKIPEWLATLQLSVEGRTLEEIAEAGERKLSAVKSQRTKGLFQLKAKIPALLWREDENGKVYFRMDKSHHH